jgi:hypothetical protein
VKRLRLAGEEVSERGNVGRSLTGHHLSPPYWGHLINGSVDETFVDEISHHLGSRIPFRCLVPAMCLTSVILNIKVLIL